MKTVLIFIVGLFLFIGFGVLRANATLCVATDLVRDQCPIIFPDFIKIVQDAEIYVPDDYEVLGVRFSDGTFTSLDQAKKTFADRKAAYLNESLQKGKTAEALPVG